VQKTSFRRIAALSVVLASILAASGMARAESRESIFDGFRHLAVILGIVSDTRDEVAVVRAQLNDVQANLATANAALATLTAQIASKPRAIVTRSTVLTRENELTAFNLDSAAGVGGFGRVKRYEVIVNLGVLARAPLGTSRVRLQTSAVAPDLSVGLPVSVLNADAGSFLSTFPFPGTTVGPYVGTNSFFQFRRGADGLGDVEVTINTVIEVVN